MTAATYDDVRLVRRPTGRRRHRSRAAAMLEFALILPLFLFLISFCVDMGRMMLISGGVQDATYRGARAGAQVGGGNVAGRQTSQNAFNQALSEIPGGASVQVQSGWPQVVTGATCTASGPNSYVTVRVRYAVPLMTPGLTSLLEAAGGSASSSGPWTMASTAVSRCEIVF